MPPAGRRGRGGGHSRAGCGGSSVVHRTIFAPDAVACENARVTFTKTVALALAPLAAACATASETDVRLASSSACEGDPREALLAVHRRARAAHLAGDAAVLAADSADQVISAQDGELRTSSRDDVLALFTRYFGQIEYRRWDDLVEPVVHMSEEGTVGWMAVRILGETRPRGSEDDGAWRQFHSSWVATYARERCAWRMTAIASEVVPVAND